ncbi:Pyrophosphatase PpaX [bioreactor metagenome]|uniref:Pyrophosphatase PpaX n=1 Tax=bioreactor metagenome TaxID=1076179 RepID=A0A645AXV4_9ZZZZ
MIFPNMLLAQAIGRWGNFVNQEAYGRIVRESFYNGWPAFIKETMYINGNFQEPTFLYESVGNIIGFILIVFIYKKISKPKRGDMVYAYLMWYGAVRLIVEQFRSDSLMFMGFKMAQITSVVFFIIGMSGMLGLFRKLFVKKPIILFDFDGTLADTEQVIMATFQKMFAKYLPDYQMTEEDRIAVLGPTLKETFEKYHFPGNFEDFVKEYREINFAMHEEYVKPMAHAEELLSALKKENYRIGIVSNKFADAIRLGLKVTKLESYIDLIIGLEEVSDPKPDPEGIRKACIRLKGSYDNCIYVGDNFNDIQAGINAGVYTIGFNEDETRKANMMKAHPNTVVAELTDILTVLKEDHSWTKDMN